MRHLLAISLFASLFLFLQPNYAQDIKKSKPGLHNTVWKSYIGGPISDTMVMRVSNDSSYFQSKTGEIMVASTFTIAGDTVVINDVSGQFACIGEPGKYKFTITADTIKFDLIEDACGGRVGAISTSTWQRAK